MWRRSISQQELTQEQAQIRQPGKPEEGLAGSVLDKVSPGTSDAELCFFTFLLPCTASKLLEPLT